MPLPMKTLKQVAAELGMPEKEVRAMVDMGKIRAVWRQNQLMIAPDEIGKLRRLRKTLPESVQPSPSTAAKPSPAAGLGVPAKPAGAKPPASKTPAAKPAAPKPGLKLPPPPPQ